MSVICVFRAVIIPPSDWKEHGLLEGKEALASCRPTLLTDGITRTTAGLSPTTNYRHGRTHSNRTAKIPIYYELSTPTDPSEQNSIMFECARSEFRRFRDYSGYRLIMVYFVVASAVGAPDAHTVTSFGLYSAGTILLKT